MRGLEEVIVIMCFGWCCLACWLVVFGFLDVTGSRVTASCLCLGSCLCVAVSSASIRIPL